MEQRQINIQVSERLTQLKKEAQTLLNEKKLITQEQSREAKLL